MMDILAQIETNCEHSPPAFSDSTMSWSWSQLRNDLEGSNTELCGLVEDKEIAARAVAFVVNSTRKGIVPLCADVANLMRSKKCLEQKVYMLKKESDVFHSSAGSVPSHSMSPTPPSISSYTENCIKALQDQSLAVQDHYRSSSRCSNSSSTYSYSPKIDKPQTGTGSNGRLGSVQYSPATSRDGRKHGSPRIIPSVYSGFRDPRKYNAKDNLGQDVITEHEDDLVSEGINNKLDHNKLNNAKDANTLNEINKSNTTLANKRSTTDIETNKNAAATVTSIQNVPNVFSFHIEDETVQNVANNKTNADAIDESPIDKDVIVKDITTETDKEELLARRMSLLERRRVSLPEMTMMPNISAFKVRPKQSKQVQCSLTQTEDTVDNSSIEDQFVKSVKLNAQLEEDLSEAKKEIEQLKKRLRKLEGQGAIPKTFEPTTDKSNDDNGYYTGSNRTSITGSEHERSRGIKKTSPKRQAATPVSYGGPLPTCRCRSCLEALGSEDDLSHYSDQYLDEPTRFAVSSKLQVQIDDHVTIKGDYSGNIRYIGHVDRSDQPNILFVGLELDEPNGRHDGTYHGKRYFLCKKGHGLLVPLADVLSKGNKKIQTKSGKEDIPRVKKHARKTSSK